MLRIVPDSDPFEICCVPVEIPRHLLDRLKAEAGKRDLDLHEMIVSALENQVPLFKHPETGQDMFFVPRRRSRT